MKAVIYARYSSKRKSKESIKKQLKSCQDYADKYGYKIIGQYIDRAYSGMSDKRPEFQRMIKDAEKKQFEYIIVYTLDRFTRNRHDNVKYKEHLRHNGIKVISATESINTNIESIILDAILESIPEEFNKEFDEFDEFDEDYE